MKLNKEDNELNQTKIYYIPPTMKMISIVYPSEEHPSMDNSLNYSLTDFLRLYTKHRYLQNTHRNLCSEKEIGKTVWSPIFIVIEAILFRISKHFRFHSFLDAFHSRNRIS